MSDVESLNIEKMSFEEAYEKLNEIANEISSKLDNVIEKL